MPFPRGGQAAASFNAKTHQSKPQVVNTCDKCGQQVGRGIRHPCNVTARRKSADKLLENDQRGREQVAVSVIREKIAENPTARNIPLQTRGGAKAMSIPNPKAATKSVAPNADQPIPAKEFRDIATGIGLSNNQAEQLGTSLRSLKGKDIIEPNAMPKIREMDRSLDSYYTSKKILIDSSDKDEDLDENGKEERWLFYVPGTKLLKLKDHIEGERYHPNTRTFIKISMDAGQSWLKLCMSIVKVQDDLSSPGKRKTRSSYKDGVLPHKFKDSGVKKIIPIAFIQNATESYENLEAIVKELGLNQLDWSPAYDMKLGLMFMGLGTAASSYPCIWCTLAKKDFADLAKMFTGGELRTLQQIHDLAAMYLEEVQAHTGARKVSSKYYFSCEHAPLFESEKGNVLLKFIIEFIPPMELHIFLGMGNALFKKLQEGMTAMGWLPTLKIWMKQINVKQSKHHSGQFNGNMLTGVLGSTDRLRTLLSAKEFDSCCNLLEAMDQLESVRAACFSATFLADDFKEKIKELATLWLRIGLPVTVKAHILFVHVAQFLDFQNESSDGSPRGLGYWSEQASESVHHDFNKLWVNGSYKRALGHSEYKEKTLKCIVTYASRHI